MAADRRPAAVVRLRKYAGVEPGFKPFTGVLKQRMMEQMAKPGAVYPSTSKMEAELGRDKSYIDAMQQLFVELFVNSLLLMSISLPTLTLLLLSPLSNHPHPNDVSPVLVLFKLRQTKPN